MSPAIPSSLIADLIDKVSGRGPALPNSTAVLAGPFSEATVMDVENPRPKPLTWGYSSRLSESNR